MANFHLTDRQKSVLSFIETQLKRVGYPPTIREIGSHLGIKSTNGVNDHLEALIRKGYLTKTEQKSRALQLVTPKLRKPAQIKTDQSAKLLSLPFFSSANQVGTPLKLDLGLERFQCDERFFHNLDIRSADFALSTGTEILIFAHKAAIRGGTIAMCKINEVSHLVRVHMQEEGVTLKDYANQAVVATMSLRAFNSEHLIAVAIASFHRL